MNQDQIAELKLLNQVYKNALLIIATAFMVPEELLDLDDGLDNLERLQMAYENMQYEAKIALEFKVK